jgi:cell division protein FtsL
MEILPIENGYGMRQQLTGVIQNKMEFFIYFVGAVTAVGGVIIYMIYGEVQNIDQNVWQQNNSLKQKISMLENELAGLTKELKELKAKESEESEEETGSSV